MNPTPDTSEDKKLPLNQIICGDCLDELKKIPDESIDMVMTSPPYWALRCYLPDKVKMKDNLTPEEKEYVEKELLKLGL